jgi:type I restriction enzyme S subunit
MELTREDALRIAREFHEALKPLYGDRLKGVYLYGSFARDEADEDSDIDVAVVLENFVDPDHESSLTSEIYASLSLRENCLLVPFFLTESEFQSKPWAIHRNIVREGVSV